MKAAKVILSINNLLERWLPLISISHDQAKWSKIACDNWDGRCHVGFMLCLTLIITRPQQISEELRTLCRVG
jgi:hypothetical protein